MSVDLEKMFGITAATAASITDHGVTGTDAEGIKFFENEIYVPRHFNGKWFEPVGNHEDFDHDAYMAQCEAQEREERFAAVADDVEEALAEHAAFDVTDDRYGVDCGHKVERDPNLEELDQQGGFIPLRL